MNVQLLKWEIKFLERGNSLQAPQILLILMNNVNAINLKKFFHLNIKLQPCKIFNECHIFYSL